MIQIMKKIIIILVNIILCSSLMAAVTEKCWITMTSDQGGTDVVKFYAEEGYTDAFDNSADVTKMWNTGNPTNVNIYCTLPCGDLSSIVTEVIKGLPINIKTNELSENYTFTFSKVLGTVILEDRLLHTYTTMVNDGTYNFTAQKNQTITGRFFIYKPGEFKVCTTFDHVELYDNAGTDNIVITNMAGDTVVNVAPVAIFQSIDLSGKDAGHYVLTVNGTDYEFCNKPVSNN